MWKKCFVYTSFVIVIILFFVIGINTGDNKVFRQEVNYNGDNLLISIDGITSDTLPLKGKYYLVDYNCKNLNTKVSWDIQNNKLSVTNGNSNAEVACYLEFKSNPKLSEMPVGSYVKYVGVGGTVGETSVSCKINGSSSIVDETAETEAPNSCLGQNAREDIDSNKNTYGYCYSDDYKYYTTGWRIAYVDNDKPVLISAGSPECNVRKTSIANVNYIQVANTKALKYCNKNYVDGDCSCLDSNNDGLCDGISLDAWAVAEFDFNMMTARMTNTKGGYLFEYIENVTKCGGVFSREECGYNNDLIDNGGYYWFAARYSSSEDDGVTWLPFNRGVNNVKDSYAYGLRPMVNLSSSVVVVGGSGTMEDPYMIANNRIEIRKVSKLEEDSEDKKTEKISYELSLMAAPQVDKMCINVNSSGCSNYVDFKDSYVLETSTFIDGENMVYVYYKNIDDVIVATLSESFTYEESE